MRDAYVADVGDFGKFGLLRTIHRQWPACRIGVVWYATDAAEKNNDGRHASYLFGSGTRQSLYRDCDAELYYRLAEIRANGRLCIESLETAELLPTSTSFYRSVVPSGEKGGRGASNLWSERDEWFARALNAVARAEFVFVDPDNGIRFQQRANSGAGDRRPSHKHAYWHEVKAMVDAGKSVVAYHHLGRRSGGHNAEIETLMRRIREAGYDVVGIRYRRGSGRVFVIIPGEQIDRRDLEATCDGFAKRWSAHCCLSRSPMVRAQATRVPRR